ncbi:fasciclin domain-containing protein [Aequorivita lipolytica]|uniref:Fasciclin domain-containing protein n=1 Tax=Aequorivita lipolytica TaxID=153267 RepID=A0A5C6YNR9_9FLAO|nr:fasciclin domain-containing protein [Aequorivita lipolytica]TXD68651.1 fasciclin domain-containing protein [Aequorivita lipolytica]SRX53209.1 hypothetical protein AEQU2_02438 [Aequorivita lipolytica]
MLKPITFLFISMFALSIVSCKNDAEDSKKIKTETAEINTVQKKPVKRAAKRDLTTEDQAMLKSVMSRVMTEPQLKKFASYIVSAELATQLLNEAGPFTVFGPSNAAIESLTAENKKFYSNPENREKLIEMLKSHIVSGKIDKETLLQTINKNGNAKLKTLSGITITVTKSGEDMVISGGKGAKATIVKGSIEGSNGMVYIVDNLLNAN